MAASASVSLAVSFILVISSSSPLATASVSYFWRQHWDSASALATSLRQFHLGHLKLLTLGDSVGLVLLAPALGLGLSLGNQPQAVLTAGSLLLQGTAGSVKLVLKVPVLAKE